MLSEAKQPRLGRVGIQIAYTVNLDDERQVALAKELALEDMESYVKHNDIAICSILKQEPLTEEQIPESILRETTWRDSAKVQLLEIYRGGDLNLDDEDGMQETMENIQESHNLEDADALWEYLDELVAKDKQVVETQDA